MTKRIDHVAIAVESIDKAMRFYRDILGLQCFTIETVEQQGVRIAKLDAGNTHVELLEPLGPDTPVGRFLQKRGEGLHHVCFGVDDINSELDRLKRDCIRLIDESPRVGAGGALIAFLHPQVSQGALIELAQPREPHDH